MRNIELKAALPDREQAIAACSQIEAACAGAIHQVDTYFNVPEGRLKLRVATPGHSELIYYRRPDLPGAKGCDYHLEPMQPSAAALLSDALGVRAVVEKTRTLYHWKNVRIHLDQVVGLGDFLEFEAVLDEEHDDSDGVRKLTFLSDIFNISDRDRIEFSYLDMVLAHV